MPDLKRLEIIEDILTCTGCDLHKQCSAPVALRGDTPADIAIIGEAPGAEEDERGEPFVGPAGRLLQQSLERVGLNEKRVAIFNTVSCFPHGTPELKHVQACRTNRTSQLRLSKAPVVLLLGRIAATATVTCLDMSHSRRRPFKMDGVVYMVGYHPAAALRDPKIEEAFEADIDAFAKLVLEVGVDNWEQMVGDNCVNCNVDAIWWNNTGLGWCEVHMPERERQKWDAYQVRIKQDYANAERSLAEIKRDYGMDVVAEAADPAWMKKAWDTLVAYLETHERFFVDDFWSDTGLERPREARALGPLVQQAAREGLMAKSGDFRKSAASNMTEKPVWNSLIHKEAVSA